MSTITFDTLKFVERLEKAGAGRELATALVEAQRESLAEALDTQLATKADIVQLDRRMDGIDSELKLLRWMVGLSLALSSGILALLAKIFLTLPH
jgi:hypothetical protein